MFSPSDVLLNSWPATWSCATKTGHTASAWLRTHKITKSAYPCFVLTPVEKKKYKTVMWHTKGSGISLFRSWQSWTARGNKVVILINTCWFYSTHWLHPSEIVNQLNLTKQLSKPEGSLCYHMALSPPCENTRSPCTVLFCKGEQSVFLSKKLKIATVIIAWFPGAR